MNYAVVDTGSNTIRMSIYTYENGNLKELFTEAVFANLAGYIIDDFLADEGIDACAEAIIHHKNTALKYDAEFYVFATAAIRNAKNCSEVKDKVFDKTGIDMQILTGEEEGELSFLGAFDDFGVKCGIMADVGGGSSEIISFADGKILSLESLPLGSLKVYKTFVSKEIPTWDEAKNIKNEIIKHIESKEDFKGIKSENLCIVGGGAMAAVKLCRLFLNRETLDAKAVNEMLEIFISRPDTLELLEKIVPKRKLTITTGLAIYSAIAEYFKSDKIYISQKGIKEGYVKKYLVH